MYNALVEHFYMTFIMFDMCLRLVSDPFVSSPRVYALAKGEGLC
jgi:hypothetical protein